MQIIFSWSYADMLCLDLELVVHNLSIIPDVKPGKHKLYKMHLQISLLIKVELHKMLDVGVIKPVDYPEWVSNIVPIDKPTGGIIICIEFRDLNK